jgi:Glycosyl transferase family 11
VPRLFPEAPLVTQQEIVGPDCRMLQEGALQGALSPAELQNVLNAQGIGHCILDGYWQDTGYVSDAFVGKLSLAMDVQARDTASQRFTTWSDRIAQAISPVAAHVRRHDYKHHGICREAYYIDSLRWIAQHTPGCEVFVFSDEPNYTGHFLRNAGIAHHQVSSGDDMLDLVLMARCNMHVIANSSFSWWGARLSDSRLTLYPTPWSQVQAPATTLFPPHWHQVDGAVTSGMDTASFAQRLEAIPPP